MLYSMWDFHPLMAEVMLSRVNKYICFCLHWCFAAIFVARSHFLNHFSIFPIYLPFQHSSVFAFNDPVFICIRFILLCFRSSQVSILGIRHAVHLYLCRLSVTFLAILQKILFFAIAFALQYLWPFWSPADLYAELLLSKARPLWRLFKSSLSFNGCELTLMHLLFHVWIKYFQEYP